MTAYEASTRIQADPETVWRVLVDVAHWPDWDSGVDRVEGTVAPDARLVVHAAVAKGRAFPVRVVHLDPPRSMTWRGGMPLGLFAGERTFRLDGEPDGRTRVDVREAYTGVLSPLIGRTIPDLGGSFEQFVTGLKARAEAAVEG